MKTYVARAYSMGSIVGEKRFQAFGDDHALELATRLLGHLKVGSTPKYGATAHVGVRCVG